MHSPWETRPAQLKKALAFTSSSVRPRSGTHMSSGGTGSGSPGPSPRRWLRSEALLPRYRSPGTLTVVTSESRTNQAYRAYYRAYLLQKDPRLRVLTPAQQANCSRSLSLQFTCCDGVPNGSKNRVVASVQSTIKAVQLPQCEISWVKLPSSDSL